MCPKPSLAEGRDRSLPAFSSLLSRCFPNGNWLERGGSCGPPLMFLGNKFALHPVENRKKVFPSAES